MLMAKKMFRCPLCGMQAEALFTRPDGSPAVPTCGMHDDTYPKMVPDLMGDLEASLERGREEV